MASSNMQIINDFMSCYATKDLDRMCEIMHPQCVIVESGELPYSGEFHGRDGLRSLLGQMIGAYDLSISNAELMDAGDRVVAFFTATIVSKRSGASVTMTVTEIYSFKDGMIARTDVFYREPGWVADLHEQQ